MKEEKAGQTEELELIDFDLEVNEETNITDENIAPNEPIPNEESKRIEKVSTTEKIVDSMQNFVMAFTEPAPVEPTTSYGEIFEKVNKAEKPLDKFKILWSEKKTKALIKLLFWIIFIVIAITIIKSSVTVTPSDDEPKETIDTAISTLSNLNNYDYTIVLADTTGSKTIAGSYFENKALFNYNYEQYYFENNIYSKVVNNKLEQTTLELAVDLNNLSPSAIASILENSEVLENTTSTDGKITARGYTIKASELISSLYGTSVTIDEEVKIDVKYLNNKISSLEINMMDIIDLQPDGKQLVGIHVEYRNIGKVTAEDVAYDMSEFDMGLDNPSTDDEKNKNNEGE